MQLQGTSICWSISAIIFVSDYFNRFLDQVKFCPSFQIVHSYIWMKTSSGEEIIWIIWENLWNLLHHVWVNNMYCSHISFVVLHAWYVFPNWWVWLQSTFFRLERIVATTHQTFCPHKSEKNLEVFSLPTVDAKSASNKGTDEDALFLLFTQRNLVTLYDEDSMWYLVRSEANNSDAVNTQRKFTWSMGNSNE